MPAEIALPLAGLVLYLLLTGLIARRAKRLLAGWPDKYLVVSVHGFRAALDTLVLLLTWVLILPGLGIPDVIEIAGTDLPTSWLMIPLFSLFLSVNLRVRILLARRPPPEE